MTVAVVIICSVLIAAASFILGLRIGREQGKAVGKIKIVRELKLFIDKVLELVPPDKYSDLDMQVEYLYERINGDE